MESSETQQPRKTRRRGAGTVSCLLLLIAVVQLGTWSCVGRHSLRSRLPAMVRSDLGAFEGFGRKRSLLEDDALPPMRYFADERMEQLLGERRYQQVEQAFLAHNGALESVPKRILMVLASHYQCSDCIVFGYREIWNTPLVARATTTYGKALDPSIAPDSQAGSTALMRREHAYLWCLGVWVRIWDRPVRSPGRS